MGWEGGYYRASSTFYKLVVQATILFKMYTWVITPRIGQTLIVFHHRVVCLLVGMKPHINTGGWWGYLPLEETIAAEGLEVVDMYVIFHQNTIAQYIETRPILELCLEAESNPGEWVAHRWWEQGGLDLEGVMLVVREKEVEV